MSLQDRGSSMSSDVSFVEVDWDGDNDKENPWNWPLPKRIAISVMVTLVTMNVTVASSAPASATTAISESFFISSEASELITTLFLLGYVAGPTIWSSLSEIYGRRIVLIVTQLAYALSILGQIYAGTNTACLLSTRLVSGVFAAAPLTLGGGMMADMFAPFARGYASTIFSLAVALGPCLGPVIGAYLTYDSGWQTVFWFLFLCGIATWATIFFLLPETYPPLLLVRKASRLRKEYEGVHYIAPHEKNNFTPKEVLTRTVFRPFEMLVKEPILASVTVYLSLVYGLLYALLEAYPIIFESTHHIASPTSSLLFLGSGIGAFIATIIYLPFLGKYRRLTVQWKGFPPPEQRLYGAFIGAPLLVIGCFWLGWAGQYEQVEWYVAGMATIVLGTAFNLLFFSFFAYIIDTYLIYSSSALAANTIVRSLFAAAFPLFTTQMFNAMGTNWACSLIGFFALALMPLPFIFYKYGVRIREKSRFAPAPDLAIGRSLNLGRVDEA